MKLNKIIIVICLLALAAGGCQKKYDDYASNPNKPASVPPGLVLTGILSDMNGDKPWSLVTRWCQFDCCNYNYYGDQRYDWTGGGLNYSTLNNVIKMEEEAQKVSEFEQKTYNTLGKFFRAWFFYRMTNLVGDLPLKDALKGAGTPAPAYDTQKEIFIQILKWLDEANTEIAALAAQSDVKIEGDIYFGSKKAWQRAINVFRLRVLIALSKKETDADLKVKQTFAAILSDPAKYPIFLSVGDDVKYVYNNINKYPSNPDNLGFDATRYNMSATYLNTLVHLKDPRTFVTAEPATRELAANHKTPADITAYVGAPSGEDLAAMSSKMSSVDTADYSLRSRNRYYSSYNAEPGILLGYTEMCFNIAEAINRGWITGDAEAWYKKGIKSSIFSYDIPVEAAGTFNKVYPFGAVNAVIYPIDFDFENVYYQQASVKYPGNNATGLQLILLQKYLAFFQNSGWEAYYNWRRTGVPTFLTGTGTGNSSRIPKRFQYPTSERTTNGDNWKKAVKNQFGSTTDDINGDMWLIK